ncbi:MAG TPA: hypothetical protein VFK42_01470 [Acidimicrobiales bacterium]|nr:hypothetical protein [Acidimicrobiales bacterium]
MLPSTDSSTPPPSRNNLRRWGPIVAIVAVIAVVAVAVALSGGGGDDDDQATTSGTNGGAAAAGATGAISWSKAKADNVKVTFPDTCDTKTGRVKLPYFYAAECYADLPAGTDNGGATSTGVTADSIKVVVYLRQQGDPVYDFITAAIKNNDTNAQYIDTLRGYFDMFQSLYQTYGRKVDVSYVEGSGGALDEVAARADAAKIIAMKPFAVLGGPALTTAFADELTANKVISIGALGGSLPSWYEQRAPYAYSVVANTQQGYAMAAEYIGKKVAGHPAKFAGDSSMQSKERRFGLLYLESNEDSRTTADQFEKDLKAKYDVDIAAKVGYVLDPAKLQEQADSAIARLKQANVTSVIFTGDPVAPGTFTRQATAQNWFPEWILGNTALADTTAFARSYDQKQWAHAFGISTTVAARTKPEDAANWKLFEWFKGTPPPAKDSAGVLLPGPSILFSGLQAAGPNLTPETFRDGLFSIQVRSGAVTNQAFSYGKRGYWPYDDYNGIDDMTEIWWDPSASGPDEIRKQGQGMYRYVDGGTRYFVGKIPATETRAFDPAGSVTLYEEPPAAEKVPDYPRP